MKKIKYVFLFLIITFISIYNVNASTKVNNYQEAGLEFAPKSCSDNVLKFGYSNATYKNNIWMILDESDLDTSKANVNKYFVELKPSTQYYFYSFNISSVNVNIFYLKEDFTSSTEKAKSTFYTNGSFITPSDTKYIFFTHYGPPSVFMTYTSHFMISETEGLTEYIPYEECSIQPETPEIPEIPEEPETPTPDSTLDDFYNLFNSKLKLIASSTLENKFMFSVIGIVVLFTVLGLFFKIFRIGGK